MNAEWTQEQILFIMVLLMIASVLSIVTMVINYKLYRSVVDNMFVHVRRILKISLGLFIIGKFLTMVGIFAYG